MHAVAISRSVLLDAHTPFWTEAQKAQAIALCAPVYLSIAPSLYEKITAAVAELDRFLSSEAHRNQSMKRHGLDGFREPEHGAFLCYDFHLTEGMELRLIEVNTNAGGLLLNDWLRSSVDSVLGQSSPLVSPLVEQMLRQSWAQFGKSSVLRQVVIVDDQPEQQILYPEFLLYAHALTSRNIEVKICTVSELDLFVEPGSDWLIYNRLTDFYLRSFPQWQKQVWVPSPATYAIYADKRNLQDMHTVQALEPWVLNSRLLSEETLEYWWSHRRQWFFKPIEGYAAKAAYRGERISRGLLHQLYAQGHYIAQTYCPASEVEVGGWGVYKVDLRVFSYAGQPLLLCARLYRGQVTNMRTEGGGFAPVYVE